MPRSPIFINIPPGISAWEAENWRRVRDALNMAVVLDNKVMSPTTGMAVTGSKVKIDANDTTANYLENKLIAGTGITLTESLTGGVGEKILTAAIGAHADLTDMPDTAGTVTDHDTRYVPKVQAATPTTPVVFTGELWWDTDDDTLDTEIYNNIVTFSGEVVVTDGNVIYLRSS